MISYVEYILGHGDDEYFTPHILVQPTQRYASQQSAVDWFDFWLNGHEDPDSAQAE